MMIDNDLKVHVLEVNGRPQLQSHVLDKAVNRPMLAEMLKIIGKVLLTKSCRETYRVVRHDGLSGNRGGFLYSHLSNKRGGWNKRGVGAKVAKSINYMEVGILQLESSPFVFK